MFHSKNCSLVREYANEKLVIEAWGNDSLRVRATMQPDLEDHDWALLPRESGTKPEISIRNDGSSSIHNGRITRTD